MPTSGSAEGRRVVRGQILQQVALARQRPAAILAAGAMFMLGVVAAGIPTGLQAVRGGAGVFGGASYGVAAAIVAWPLLLSCTTAALVGADYESGMTREAVIAGVPRLALNVGHMAAAISLALCGAALAPVGGVLSGAADAVRQHGPLLGRWQMPAVDLPALLLESIPIVAVTLVLCVVMRRRSAPIVLLACCMAATPWLVHATRGSGAIEMLPRLLPTAAYSFPGTTTPGGPTAVVVSAVAWTAIAALAAVAVLRQRRDV